MGQRSNTETVVAILQALLKERTCSQAELGRRAGVSSQVARKHLEELLAYGFPLERDGEPPQVFWSVPPDWFPGAVVFEPKIVPELLRQLCRLPRSKMREQLVRRILDAAPRPAPAPPDAQTVLTPQWTDIEETYLPAIEDAARDKAVLALKYRAMGREDADWRPVSIQRVLVGPPARFIAYCHKSKKLKWYRLGNVWRAERDTSEPFQHADPGEVEAVLKQSVDGYHQGGAVECSFVVREPECQWVVHNLPAAMSHAEVPGGMRFTTSTAGVLRLARFVVGLGGAARAETPELQRQVTELARGTLDATSASTTSWISERPSGPS